MAENGWKGLKMAGNRWKWQKIDENGCCYGWQRQKNCWNSWTLLKIVLNRFKKVDNGWKRLEMAKTGENFLNLLWNCFKKTIETNERPGKRSGDRCWPMRGLGKKFIGRGGQTYIQTDGNCDQGYKILPTNKCPTERVR